MMKIRRFFNISALIAALCFCGVVFLSACTPTASSTTPAGEAPATHTLRVMTHDSFAISESVLEAFQQANHVTVQFLKSGDTGTALNKAILAKNNPLADVFYGVDNTFLSRALKEDIFEVYASPVLQDVPTGFQLDDSNRALPVDYGDVCLNYDKVFFQEHNLPPPESLDDLIQPAYKSLLVVQNPATSSPGLSFLLTTIGNYGEDGYLDYWKALVRNDVQVVDSWETAYNTSFSGAGGKGPRPIVVSYNSSPVFELIYATEPVSEPSTAALVAPRTCFRQIEFVGILRGAKDTNLARKWVDFMLSPTFQEDMPEQMFVFPVNSKAVLGADFAKFLQIPEETAQVSPDLIAAQREKWLKDWTATVLQ